MLANLPRARELASAEGLQALICVLPVNVYYLSDYESDWLFDLPWAACAILPVREEIPATLVVHDVELTNLAQKPSWMPNLRVYQAAVNGRGMPHYAIAENADLEPDELCALELMEATRRTAADGLVQGATQALAELGLEKAQAGFDDLRFLNACRSRLPGLEGRDILDLMIRIRMVKTQAEAALMREAARRNALALKAAIAAARPGVLWEEVRRAYQVAAVRQDCAPFCMYVGAGRRSMGLQARHDYAIERDEQLCFDAMLTYRRYFGDVQRTCILGRPSRQLERYWNAVAATAEECYAMMRPGMDTGLLRKRAIELARKAGAPGFRHAFVHGLGLEHLEVPRAGGQFGTFRLEEGMIVNMDLEICEIGFGGVYLEDTVRIGRDGPEYFYDPPREAIRLEC